MRKSVREALLIVVIALALLGGAWGFIASLGCPTW